MATRLVEETETHVVVGLLLLLLLSGGRSLLSGGGGTTSGGSGSTTTGATRGNGSELLRSGSDELVDVLALKLGDQLVEALIVRLDTDSLENGLRAELEEAIKGACTIHLTLTSAAEGEVLPPRPRRRYAARCFILNVGGCW